jgi:UDP-N-acetylglucosamine--N-acetylmuramyl-(pentapeptide) pyrophosphoryl-undecaprenol N-acetylglucosamine transferase
VFPALAIAEQLPEYQIEWLGVPDRLENQLVPERYRLHQVPVQGIQTKPNLKTLKILWDLLASIVKTRHLLQRGKFDGVLTTGGYIAAPAVIAARSLGLPVLLHESNALPGKVTRFLSRWCTLVAIGFEAAAQHLPGIPTRYVGTPVRQQFIDNPGHLDLPVPPEAKLVAVVGGSQGAVGLNKLVRQAAPALLEAGIWLVHQTGANDPDNTALQHPHYIALPFYQDIAALFKRSDVVVSRSGAGTLTELAFSGTPSLLIPYPYAAEDHQAVNAQVFVQAGAAKMFRQGELTPELLSQTLLDLIQGDREQVQAMAQRTASLAVRDSAAQVAKLVRAALEQQCAQP